VYAVVTNGPELGLENLKLQGETKKSEWGDTISGKSVSNSSRTMWATVNLPADAELAGKTLKLTIIVEAIYPHVSLGHGVCPFELMASPKRAGGSIVSCSTVGNMHVRPLKSEPDTRFSFGDASVSAKRAACSM
jgi:hypothetical protein